MPVARIGVIAPPGWTTLAQALFGLLNPSTRILELSRIVAVPMHVAPGLHERLNKFVASAGWKMGVGGSP